MPTLAPSIRIPVYIMNNPSLDVPVSFFGQVNAEASTASPSTREEGPHNDAQHNAPEALEPVCPDEDTVATRTDNPVIERNKTITKNEEFYFPQNLMGCYTYNLIIS